MNPLDAMALSTTHDVYLSVLGREALILTGCRIGDTACMSVELADGNRTNYDVPVSQNVTVIRVEG